LRDLLFGPGTKSINQSLEEQNLTKSRQQTTMKVVGICSALVLGTLPSMVYGFISRTCPQRKASLLDAAFAEYAIPLSQNQLTFIYKRDYVIVTWIVSFF
jgi:hypothetical protein